MSVRTTVECWGLGALVDDAVLVVSELVTNAVQHAAPVRQPGDEPARCRLTVERPGPGTVRVSVSDASPRRLVQRKATAEEESGRGLVVLDALTVSWDVETSKTGKTVRAVLRATS
ncbi:ATP-binding protein [Streptomyces sp. ISL-98]|nr:ATP-binding protein [Streptomyces sp. ISL-98]